jgi:hypothetical protein
MRGRLVLFALAAVAAGAGCFEKERNALPRHSRDVLEQSSQLEIFLLDPTPPREELADSFHGWKVLGKTAVADPGMRKWVAQNIIRGIVSEHGTAPGPLAPRHGVRARQGEDVVDLLCCTKTRTLTLYHGPLTFTTPTDDWLPAGLFDKILFDAGLRPGNPR